MLNGLVLSGKKADAFAIGMASYMDDVVQLDRGYKYFVVLYNHNNIQGSSTLILTKAANSSGQ